MVDNVISPLSRPSSFSPALNLPLSKVHFMRSFFSSKERKEGLCS